ncbi:MAG: DUF1992 domain-containing protein [Maritimibacter sp.]|nr:DUF1992 domain-containing protein [Maritimibacter sp.]
MSHPLNPAIELAMKAAEKADEFKDLPGAGKPLSFLSEPKDAVIDRLMKEHRARPLAVELKTRLSELRKALQSETDETARKALMKESADTQLRLDLELDAIRKYG